MPIPSTTAAKPIVRSFRIAHSLEKFALRTRENLSAIRFNSCGRRFQGLRPYRFTLQAMEQGVKSTILSKSICCIEEPVAVLLYKTSFVFG